ncbi:unnamed protein product, partial [Prorocentrum cordatum]
ACGTDIEGLQSIKDILFPEEKSQISFKEMYEVLLHLRRGKPASVTDVVNLRELFRRRTQELKELFLQRRFLADHGGGFVGPEEAMVAFEQARVHRPLDRVAYHLFNAMNPWSKFGPEELFNESQVIGQLYSRSFPPGVREEAVARARARHGEDRDLNLKRKEASKRAEREGKKLHALSSLDCT